MRHALLRIKKPEPEPGAKDPEECPVEVFLADQTKQGRPFEGIAVFVSAIQITAILERKRGRFLR